MVRLKQNSEDIFKIALLQLSRPQLVKLASQYDAMPNCRGQKTKKIIVASLLDRVPMSLLISNPIINDRSILIRNSIKRLREKEKKQKQQLYSRLATSDWPKNETETVKRSNYKIEYLSLEAQPIFQQTIAAFTKFLSSNKVSSIEDTIALIKNPLLPLCDRANLCWFLPKFERAKSLFFLVELLDWPEAEIRAAAAIELGNFNEKEAIEKLVFILQDSDDRVVFAAINSLANLKAPGVTSKAIEILENPSSPEQLQMAAAKALSFSQDFQAIKALNSALLSESAKVKFWANYALEKILDNFPND